VSAPEEAVRNRDHAATLVGALVAGGVRHAVISPGSRNTPIVLALDALAQSDHRLILHSVLDERAAAFFALGIARATGTPALLSCTSGSAGAHYLPAIIEAFHAHIPLIALTADRPPELQGRGAPQTIDQHGLFGVHVRASVLLTPPDGNLDSVRTAAQDAIAAAHGVAPGPVHINAPYRKPLWHPEAPAMVACPKTGPEARPTLHLKADDTGALAARLAEAERGVVVWGPDPDPSLNADPILDLAQHLGWPVLATPTSPARFRSYRPGTTVTTHDAFLRDDEIAQALRPELVLQLGGTPSSNALRSFVGAAPDVIAIDPRGVWRDPEHSLKTLIEADPGPLATALLEHTSARPDGDWVQRWASHETAAQVAMDAWCQEDWWSGRFVQTLLGALPAGTLLHAASSMPIRDLDTFGRHQAHPIWAHANRGVNGIDGTLATTLGLATAWDQGPVVALVGDLAFLHDQGSLMLARGIQHPVVVLVIDNGGGSIFEQLPIATHPTAFQRWFLTPQQSKIQALCAAAEVRYECPEQPVAMTQALQHALHGAPGLSVIHLVVDRATELRMRRNAVDSASSTQ